MFGAGAENGKQAAVDHAQLNSLAHFVFAQTSFFEIQFHERLVVFGSHFNQLVVQLVGPFLFVGRNIQYFGFASASRIFIQFHFEDIDNRIEAWSCIHRVLDDGDLIAKDVFGLVDRLFEVDIFVIQLVEHKNHRFFCFFGIAAN